MFWPFFTTPRFATRAGLLLAVLLAVPGAVAFAQERFINRQRIDDLTRRVESLEKLGERIVGRIESLHQQSRAPDRQTAAAIAELRSAVTELRRRIETPDFIETFTAPPFPSPFDSGTRSSESEVRREIDTLWNNPKAEELGVFNLRGDLRLRLTRSNGMLLVRYAGGGAFTDVVGKLHPVSPRQYAGRVWAHSASDPRGAPLKHDITIELTSPRMIEATTQLDFDGDRPPRGFEAVRTFTLYRR